MMKVKVVPVHGSAETLSAIERMCPAEARVIVVEMLKRSDGGT